MAIKMAVDRQYTRANCISTMNNSYNQSGKYPVTRKHSHTSNLHKRHLVNETEHCGVNRHPVYQSLTSNALFLGTMMPISTALAHTATIYHVRYFSA